MRYLHQLSHHDPDAGIYGDCYRTCLACLMDFDRPSEVPHFMDGMDDGGDLEMIWRHVDEWLQDYGLALLAIPYDAEPDAVMQSMEIVNPGLRYMIGGTGTSGAAHIVIARGGKIEHDPNPHGEGLVGPDPDGRTWVNFLVDRDCHVPEAQPAGAAA